MHKQKTGEKKKTPKLNLTIILLTILIVVIMTGLFLSHSSHQEPLEGIVDTDEINITSKVTSRVDKLLALEGDTVRKGQIIAFMRDPQTSANAIGAGRELSREQAARDRSYNGTRIEKIRSLERQWLSAQADEELAAVTARRQVELFKKGAVSAQQKDDAVSQQDAAHNQTQVYHQQYLEALHGDREEDKRIATLNVGIAKASLESALSLVEELDIQAPASGELSQRFANPGELITAGTPIFTLIDLNNLWVSINIREDLFNEIKMHDRLTGKIPSLNNKEAEFKVTFINPKADFATWRATRQSSGYDIRTFEVRVRPVSPVKGLRPGMTVLFDWSTHHE